MKYEKFNKMYESLRAYHIPRKLAYKLTVLIIL